MLLDTVESRYTIHEHRCTSIDDFIISENFRCLQNYFACRSFHYYYSEHVELFFGCVDLLGISNYPFLRVDLFELSLDHHDAKIFYDLIDLIREKVKSDEFISKVYRRNKDYINAYLDANAYIDSLFEHYSNLTVVNIDLGYKPSFSTEVTISDMHRHLNSFNANMKEHDLMNKCVGVVWRLEIADLQCPFFRFVLFFSQTGSTKDFRRIGDYWCTTAASEYGCYNDRDQPIEYFNLQSIKKSINYLNDIYRDTISFAVANLARRDFYIRLRDFPSDVNFGHGTALSSENSLSAPLSKESTHH